MTAVKQAYPPVDLAIDPDAEQQLDIVTIGEQTGYLLRLFFRLEQGLIFEQGILDFLVTGQITAIYHSQLLTGLALGKLVVADTRIRHMPGRFHGYAQPLLLLLACNPHVIHPVLWQAGAPTA